MAVQGLSLPPGLRGSAKVVLPPTITYIGLSPWAFSGNSPFIRSVSMDLGDADPSRVIVGIPMMSSNVDIARSVVAATFAGVPGTMAAAVGDTDPGEDEAVAVGAFYAHVPTGAGMQTVSFQFNASGPNTAIALWRLTNVNPVHHDAEAVLGDAGPASPVTGTLNIPAGGVAMMAALAVRDGSMAGSSMLSSLADSHVAHSGSVPGTSGSEAKALFIQSETAVGAVARTITMQNVVSSGVGAFASVSFAPG